MYKFFATCPKLIEGLLEDELRQLGAQQLKQTVAGVFFAGPVEMAYKACLWSRLANRILLIIGSFPVNSSEELYQRCYELDWSAHISADRHSTLCVDFNGHTTFINNTQFGAQKVKDAVVDHLRDKTGQRPNVDRVNPDIRINAYIHHQQATISIDFSGHSLHQRGYRLAAGEAPVKENIAAAVLLRANWPAIATAGGILLDPVCGSGTLLIEAALMAANIAPGLYTESFGFKQWLRFDKTLWQSLWEDAQQKRLVGLEKGIPEIHGYDADPRVIGVAKDNIERAGLTNYIRVSVKELNRFTPPTHKQFTPGLVVANPPYGERLGEVATLTSLYEHFGDRLREHFIGWRVALLTGNPDLGKQLGMRARKHHALLNGALECKLLLFTVEKEWFYREKLESKEHTPITPVENLTSGAEMIANRLQKNIKNFASWRTTNNIHCYRVYDADMPEYAAAIDYYEDKQSGEPWLHVQEYAPPDTIPEEKSAHRWQELLTATKKVFQIPESHIITKTRARQKGLAQYEKQDHQQNFITVQEGACQLLVNLTDYLDTGLFLDSRLIRARIAQYAKNRNCLNLYCYTGSATVHALAGGAKRVESVDLSHTYCQWAKRNIALNGFSEQRHPVIQADCWQWLEENDQLFDLILLDPPTFSNSKRMQNTLDIQRDHVELLHKTMRHLSPKGILIFCTNFRRFKLDTLALQTYHFKDITAQTIDKDFARNQRIHHCWEITHYGLPD